MAKQTRIRQMPKIFIRGSLASQTMANLTDEQKQQVNDIVKVISKDSSIMGTKYEFIMQLGATIGGDYKDRSVAEQEFLVAIWRATIHLLYHRSYSYSCILCGSTSYITQKKASKAIDQQFKICPSCNCSYVNVDNQKMMVRVNKEDKYAVIEETNEKIHFTKIKNFKKSLMSPIRTILGEYKIANHEEIITDDTQRHKWYTVWIWNYFRQILNENKIKTHRQKETTVSGPAINVAARIIANELKSLNKLCLCDQKDIMYKDDNIEIFTNVLETPQKFTKFLQATSKSYKNHNVKIDVLDDRITLSTTGNQPIINDVILTSDTVEAISRDYANNKGIDSIKNSIDNNTVENQKFTLKDIIEEDYLSEIRNNLLEDNSKKLFDIYCQIGPTWTEFSDKYGESTPYKKHLVEYLKCDKKEIDYHKQLIKAEIFMTQA